MIELQSVRKTYPGGQVAVGELSFEIASHEFCVLVGPSGCGKTTTMKMINRLIEPTSGTISIDGTNVLDVNPVTLRRGIGYVMQQGGLFPHLRVADNVATVPRLLGWPKDTVRDRVAELLELVGLDAHTYARRYPHELSGGERQRVGVARALGGDPPILLMDEPFGAVDPITRRRLQDEFLELQRRLGKTTVFVTHDVEEALLLGQRIAILNTGGVLEQYDTPEAILSRPATPFVAEFVGTSRNLQRLAVSRLEPSDTEQFPTIGLDGRLSDIESLLQRSSSKWLVVVDPDGRPSGFLGEREGLAPGRTAGELSRPFGQTVPIGTSLRAVLSVLLEQDEELVAVVDGERYVGVLTLVGLQAAVRRLTAAAPPM